MTNTASSVYMTGPKTELMCAIRIKIIADDIDQRDLTQSFVALCCSLCILRSTRIVPLIPSISSSCSSYFISSLSKARRHLPDGVHSSPLAGSMNAQPSGRSSEKAQDAFSERCCAPAQYVFLPHPPLAHMRNQACSCVIFASMRKPGMLVDFNNISKYKQPCLCALLLKSLIVDFNNISTYSRHRTSSWCCTEPRTRFAINKSIQQPLRHLKKNGLDPSCLCFYSSTKSQRTSPRCTMCAVYINERCPDKSSLEMFFFKEKRLLLFFLHSSFLMRVGSSVVDTSRSRLRILYHIETDGYTGDLAGVGLVRDATRSAHATFDRIPIHTRTPQKGVLFLDAVYCPGGRDGNNTCTPYELPQLCPLASDTDPSRKVHLSHLKRENYTRPATLHELTRNPERLYYTEWLGGGIEHIDVVVYLILDCSPMEWQVIRDTCTVYRDTCTVYRLP